MRLSPASRHRYRTGRPLLALALVVVTLVVAGCTSPDEDRVLVLGDSITFLVAEQMTLQFDGTDTDLGIVAIPGATTDRLLEEARILTDQKPVAVIVNLGTNDVLHSLPLDEAASTLREIVQLFPGASCIGLTTIYERLPAVDETSSPQQDAIALNEEIHAIARSDLRISVIDWNHAVIASPDELLDDDIHPNDSGADALVEVYTAFLSECSLG